MAGSCLDANWRELPRALWTWDLSSNAVSATPGYRHLLGVGQDERLRPFHIVPLTAPEDRDRMLDALFRTMANVPTPEVTFRITTRAGRDRLLLGTAHMVRDEDGAPIGVRGRIRDVTPCGESLAQERVTREAHRGTVRVAIAGNDRLARLGLRSLLAPFPTLQLVGDFEATTAGLRACVDAGQRVDAVVVDVDGESGSLNTFIAEVLAAWPGCRVIASIRPVALHSVGWLALAGVRRLVTSDISAEALAQAVAGDGPVSRARIAEPEQRPVLVGESAAFELASRLTEAELRVLGMLSSGYRNREIAASLYLSEPTVKRYTQQIYRKLGARDRAHAASLANKFGLT